MEPQPRTEPIETKQLLLVVNGEDRRVAAGTTVAGLLSDLGIDGARVAVEVNRSIVRKQDWSRVFQQLDRVEIVWFVGGGA